MKEQKFSKLDVGNKAIDFRVTCASKTSSLAIDKHHDK
jgi:hypothetical protein